MKSLRENVLRGTADCPISSFSFKSCKIGEMITPSHWHPEFEILYCKIGELSVGINGEELRLKENQIMFVMPNELHSIYIIKNNSEYNAFVLSLDLISLPENHFFQKDFVLPLMEGRLYIPRIIDNSDPDFRDASFALDEISKLDRNSDNYKLNVFSGVMSVCFKLSYFSRLSPLINRENKSNDIIKAVIEYIEDNYSRTITLKDISDNIHLHPNYLCNIFKKITGQSIFSRLLHYRINRSCEFLKASDLSIAEISERCGFLDPNFFSRKFREIMGTSPSKFRKDNMLL